MHLMNILEKKPNADPFGVVRSLPITSIPINKIKVRDGIPLDEIFISKYRNFLLGKSPIHQTRISLSKIRRGLWKSQNGRWELIHKEPSDKDVEYIVSMIQSGDRPALHLYESPCPEDECRFICSDDLSVHAAYERLGIDKVPAAFMGKPKDLEESSLSVRSFSRGKKKSIVLLDGVVPVTHELVPSLLETPRPHTVECLKSLVTIIDETKTMLRRFHRASPTAHHYHHTLYSVLLRAKENLEGMRILIETGKVLAAAALLRSLYELTLVFYIDWLAPSLTYKYLQMASAVTESEWETQCETWRKEDMREGASALDAKNIKDAHMRGIRLASIIGERARVFPLGQSFHRDVYQFLSDVVHHDFSMTARYTYALEGGDEVIYNDDVMNSISHLADILVAAVVTRIQSDIGLPN
jgi:hypothetical protein